MKKWKNRRRRKSKCMFVTFKRWYTCIVLCLPFNVKILNCQVFIQEPQKGKKRTCMVSSCDLDDL